MQDNSHAGAAGERIPRLIRRRGRAVLLDRLHAPVARVVVLLDDARASDRVDEGAELTWREGWEWVRRALCG